MEIEKFTGLKNTTSQERLAKGELSSAKNIDLDDKGKIRTRTGYELLRSGATHSVYAVGGLCVFVNNANMYRLGLDLTTVTHLQTLESNAPVSYTAVNDEDFVLYSNGIDKGQIRYGSPLSWGIDIPFTPVATAVGGGGLAAGVYHYALTYTDERGAESGSCEAGTVEIPQGSGIRFSSIPISTSSRVRGKILYLSAPGGDVLYTAAVFRPETTDYIYLDGKTGSVPLRTQFCFPPPAGDIVEYWNGTAFVVDGDVVWASPPYMPELFRLATDYIPFPGQITLFIAVDDGIYVATDSVTWFLSGDSWDKFTAREVFPYGAIAGTQTLTEASHFGGSEGKKAAVWASPRGACVGLNGGAAHNLTEKSFSFPSAQRGAGVIRQVNGFTQFLAVLKGTGEAFNAAD